MKRIYGVLLNIYLITLLIASMLFLFGFAGMTFPLDQ